MKKLAVICLIASLSFSAGSIPVFAQTVDYGKVTVQEQTAVEKETDQSSTEEVETGKIATGKNSIADVSVYDYPDDWDPEDPQNARAYKQLMAADGQSGNDASALYGISTQAAAVTTTWGGKTYTHNDFNTQDCDVVPCIDVSYHQGEIDWKKVKAAGIDYVILRVGYRASASGTLNRDKMFDTYIKDAQSAGLKVGVYIYSQAISVKEAEEEAEFTLDRIKNYKIDLPVTFDYEYYGAQEGRLYNAHLSKSAKTKCAEAFCKKVTAAGYQAMIYANSSWCESEMDTEALHQNYQIWMARYNSYSYKESADKGVRYGGQIDFWQCSESAKVDGITTGVDFNWWYKGKNTQTGNGIVYDSDMGKWIYKVNGKIDTDFTGFAQNENGWWYVENGQVTFKQNDVIYGTVNGETAWWHVKNSQVMYDTTVAHNENGWWYVKDGKVDFTYNGFAENENGWWYLEDGKVTLKKDGIIHGEVDGETAWWHVKDSKVTSDTTVAHNANGWWYVKDGKVDFTYEGFADNENGWWYLENGKVTFKKDDIIHGEVNGETAWWHIKDSKVTSDTTVAHNANGWWYVKDGKVDFTYEGFADNENGWWYLENGKVTFKKDDIIHGEVNGETAWWHIKDSKVTSDTTVAHNANGWWYVKDGQVDFTYNGIAENENGWWYIKDGKVDFTYNGKVTVKHVTYTVKDGKVKH